eukprot:792636-Amphidinium_carterae.1
MATYYMLHNGVWLKIQCANGSAAIASKSAAPAQVFREQLRTVSMMIIMMTVFRRKKSTQRNF